MDTNDIRYLFSILKISIFFVLIMIIFTMIVQYPYIDKDLTQANRIRIGLDNLSESTPLVYSLAANASKSKYAADAYLYSIFPYKSDYENYGIRDYWATPDEMIKKGSGDCEDFAVLLKSVSGVIEGNFTDTIKRTPTHAYVETKTGEKSYYIAPEEKKNSIIDTITTLISNFFDFQNLPRNRFYFILLGIFIDYCFLNIMINNFHKNI